MKKAAVPLRQRITTVVVIGVVAFVTLFVGRKVSAAKQTVYMRFVFAQVGEALKDAEKFPTTDEELFELLENASIDWRICELKGSELIDPWGKSVSMSYDSSGGAWIMTSRGADRKAGTGDDLEATLSSPGGRQRDR